LSTLPAYLNNEDPTAEAVAEISTVTDDGSTVVYTDAAGEQIGFVDITDPANPVPSGTIDVGGVPTSVHATGDYLMVAVDTSESFVDPSGLLLVVAVEDRTVVRTLDLGGQPDSIDVDASDVYAVIAIENQRDEDLGEGGLPQLPAGYLTIVDLADDPADWTLRTVDLTGLDGAYEPSDPEPEYVAINADGQVVVTLQENNALAVVNVATGTVVTSFTAGAVDLDGIDVVEDGIIDLSGSLSDVPREPDAIAWVGDDLVATANEGDLFGGSRGWTIFDVTTGEPVWDAGSSLEHLSVRSGLYPEGRSEAKGAEPEGLTFGTYGGTPYVFVAVYDLSDPLAPAYVQTLPSTNGPEGLLVIEDRGLLAVSSEEDDVEAGVRATLQIYGFGADDAEFPQIVSADDADGRPVGWGALSALAADPSDPSRLVSVSDSFYATTKISSLDVSQHPALLDEVAVVTEDGAPATLDAEGIAPAAGGGWWIASEGETGPDNMLVEVDADGVIEARVALPDEVAAGLGSNGLEGVATSVVDGNEIIWVALQRELLDDPAGVVRIGRYDSAEESWAWYGYPIDAPPSEDAWVGLSEIIVLDANSLAVIERDNQAGPAATVKQVASVDLPSEIPGEGQLPVLEKTVAADLLPRLRQDNGWTQEKVEGLAIGGDGNVYAVTDNDGVDDASGETVFWSIGPADEVFAGAIDPTPPGTPTPTPTSTLPPTGAGGSGSLALAGVGLLGAGVLILGLARRRLQR